ncbi:MAG: CopG family transcriptional regulator [Zetaproteobacteria bacterium CG2_30_46_52]|nr:MAG: CopG family transcriptional regulator [Zetaproteobacteria bacterium CG2_30_46_52]
MNFSLTPSLEQFVRDKASTGDYNNASEVIREAIRLLKEKDELRAIKLEQLRAAIRLGDEAIEQGQYTDINSKKELDAFFAKL